MNGRQFTFGGISGHPLAQFLAMIVMGVVLVAAVVMGAFLLVALAGIFVVGYSLFWIRARWRWNRLRHGGPRGGVAEPGPAKAAGYIEGDYEVVEADADPARRSGNGL